MKDIILILGGIFLYQPYRLIRWIIKLIISNIKSMKIFYWVLGVVVVLALIFGVYKVASAEELTCPDGEKVESVEVTAEIVIHHDAVTHIEHHDAIEGYWEYRYKIPFTSTWSGWSLTNDAPWHSWYNALNQKRWIDGEEAYDEVVVDEEAYDEVIPAVYEDQCVVDSEYIPPVEEPAPSAPEPEKLSSPSGGRHPVWTTSGWYCPQPLRQVADPFNHCPGQHIEDGMVFGGVSTSPITSIQMQLIDLMNQLVVLLQKLTTLQ